MSAADKLTAIEARVNAATPGPWEARQDDLTNDVNVMHDQEHVSYVAHIGLAGKPRVAEDAEFIAHARQDVPALVNALRAVLQLHYAADNDADRTPACQECHGKAGVHSCGCWAPEDRERVCGHCNEGRKGARVPYPCPTVRAIEEAL